MSESIHPTNTPEGSQPEPGRRFPSEQELDEFELARSMPRIIGYPIEEIAKDPDNPTVEELEVLEAMNRPLAGEIPTFEGWFGYPDPREPENRDGQQEPGGQDH